MRIGIEAQRIFRKKKHGMDIYALELIRELQKSDLENEYFIFVKPDEDHCLEETSNFKIVELSGITYADWEQVSLPNAAKKLRLDVLHCTSNTAPAFCSVPTVLTLHDIIYLNKSFSGGSLYQRLGHYYRKWIVPAVFRHAKKVMTVSDFEKNGISQILGESSKVSTVYNGVASKFKPLNDIDKSITKLRLGLPDNYIFFLGNTAPKKNMKGMLEAYGHYCEGVNEPLSLVIAESSKQEVEDVLRELQMSKLMTKVHLTGYVSHADLPAIYASADLFVYPSLRESFGIPIIEAMACGTAVITSNTSSMPEVSGGAAHLTDPTRPMDIAAAMVYLLEENNYKLMLERKGLQRAETFRWQSTASKVKEIYESLQFVKNGVLAR